jgi:hypothetical protein
MPLVLMSSVLPFGRRARHRLGRDHATTTRPAVDDDRLSTGACDLVSQDPRERVDGTAGGHRHDDPHCARRLRP